MFVAGDVVITHAISEDLDYWNIRQWRAMWRHLLKCNYDYGVEFTVNLVPSNPKPF